jgi:hypothetical protein
MALFGGRASEKKRRTEAIPGDIRDAALEDELTALAPSAAHKELDRAGSEVKEVVTRAAQADLRQMMMIQHGRCPQCQGRTDSFLFTVVCPSCGWHRREAPDAGRCVVHMDTGDLIECDRTYRTSGGEVLCVKDGVVIAQVAKAHVVRTDYLWTPEELDALRERARKLAKGLCSWCERDLAGAGPDGPLVDYVAIGAFQERYVFCSEACMASFRKHYPSRIHKNCYETECRDCDKCIKRYDDDGFRRKLL